MKEYIGQWFEVIEKMQNTNTYKLAWGRGVLEIIAETPLDFTQHKVVISLAQIAAKMLKYYWNQTYFFSLRQGPISQEPKIIPIVREAIEFYQNKNQTMIPVWYNFGSTFLKKHPDFYNRVITKITRILPENVAWRFLNIAGIQYPLYYLNVRDKQIEFSYEQAANLKEDAVLLAQFINYRWAQLLEKFNRSPKISSKVSGSQEQDIRRSSLTEFKRILLELQPSQNPIDFYSNQVIEFKDVSVDHVIPWSFVFSDDLWNLVITSKSYNSVKSNSVPSQTVIQQLNHRNQIILPLLKDKPKLYSTMFDAVQNRYVDRFYQDLRF